MSIISDLLSGGFEGILKGGKEVIDEFVTTDEERQQAKLKLEKLIKEHEAKAREEVSKRHKHDMQSDSWLSKNVRPIVLLGSLSALIIFSVADGAFSGFKISSNLISILGQILTAAIAFYFGSRGYEKKKVIEAVRDIKKEREKTIQKSAEITQIKDLPRVSLSPDE